MEILLIRVFNNRGELIYFVENISGKTTSISKNRY